jgi:DNA polymerase III gamma/tau subunit
VEYDAAIVGNVERIKELRDTFFINMSNGYRVITFDEVHMASNAAQNALLKALEEVRPSIYFLFATTEVEKIIPTIRSRSLELRFDVIPHDDIVKNLRGVLDQAAKGVEFSDFVLNTIATRSRGHMRNAHMYLDSLIMVGEKDFLESVRSAHDVFLKYFQAIAVKDKSAAFSALDELCTFPLADLKSDFEQVCLDMVKTLVGYKKVEGMLFDTVKSLGAETLKFVKQAVSEWVLGSFESDQTFQAAMLCLYQMFAGQGGQSVTSSAPLSGGVRRVGKQC